jgi:hypothetical protein
MQYIVPKFFIFFIFTFYKYHEKLIAMATFKGNLTKMESKLENPVKYALGLNGEKISMNDLIGKSFRMEYLHQIHCKKCGRETKKSFFQGFCYPCFVSAPEAEDCVLRPERCKAHLGEARDIEYARAHCLIDHHVYMAWSGGLKVGVTRHTQIPTRWIDQGATRAMTIARAPNRYLAGEIEVFLKSYLKDKTNWRNMLANKIDGMPDFQQKGQEIQALLKEKFPTYMIPLEEAMIINYPVPSYPAKVKPVNLEKEPVLEGTLSGIRGQYLYIDGNRVINIRKYTGYLVEIKV